MSEKEKNIHPFFKEFADLCLKYNVLFWEEDFRISLEKIYTFDVHICGTLWDGCGAMKRCTLNVRKVDPKVLEITSEVL